MTISSTPAVQAMGIRQVGDASQLQPLWAQDCPSLDPANTAVPADHVRVRHYAVGVNYIDVYHRTGLYSLPQLPAVLGVEAAGIVVAAGSDVPDLKPGDRVAYVAGPGSYCQVRTLPALTVCKLPKSIAFDTAAAMMLKGLTVQYLFERTLPQGGLQAGDWVLFHAAAGGVGLIACQWARALGLRLIATAGSSAKCQLALEFGATEAINYRNEDWVQRVRRITGAKGVKVVYDSVGHDTFTGSLNCLAPFGLMVSFGNASGKVAPVDLGVLASLGSLYVTRPTLFTHLTQRAQVLAMSERLFAMVESQSVKIPIHDRLPLSAVAQAHAALESRNTTGSIVLELPAA